MKWSNRLIIMLLIGAFLLSGCISTKVTLFRSYSEPLKEYTLEGEGDGKVLMIPVKGVITSRSKNRLLYTEPGTVQEIVSHLEMAAEDKKIKVVVLQIDSPGGTVTASDILYHEIKEFKNKTGKKVVIAMMNLAASGGYYIALAGDEIYAHPTTVTGSIGVIFIRPDIEGLMGKIGVEADVTKSGVYKDMGSPFRKSTETEQELFQGIIDELYGRFVGLIAENRGLDPDQVRAIADGRIYTAQQALDLKLIDRIGYLDEAIAGAKQIAGLPDNAQVVVYRRTERANDNRYYTATGKGGGGSPKLIDLGIPEYMNVPDAGFYYLWTPGVE
ncbi:MAG TPA: signal peptide peptidase SppA [Nitrospirae bacterium]|nr:putative signal peptide peptidase SppA [bacterium BMS3Abin10]GBE38623.1 putative signal peptide peptidase SppA [bacterium BMS3Bbin08]HDH51614.1 signal peptide peptidase SppA [Nitrospirota bacterium]HDK82614.1 signal peptide peptidase SppA [Nitrospirota bacterium]